MLGTAQCGFGSFAGLGLSCHTRTIAGARRHAGGLSKTQKEAHMATVVGMFEHSRDANELIEDLQREGFAKTQIGVVARHEVLRKHGLDVSTGTEVGAITGATTGGIAGLLVGLGALLIPGLDLVAAGTFLVVVGATVLGLAGGAVAGGLVGSLAGFGLSEERAHRYAEGVSAGHILVTVQSLQERVQMVAELMRGHNAIEVDIAGGPEASLVAPRAAIEPPSIETQPRPPTIH
jgi:uncharacterized membrane protein